MDVNAISNNSIDIYSLLNGGANGINRVQNVNDVTNQTPDYAKKGEPMYMEEMDSDGDGTVTFDEFREYCKTKGMNTRDIVKMSQLASTYRTMKAEKETMDYISKLIPNSSSKLKQTEFGKLQQDGEKYNISNEAGINNKVSYKDYMDYCNQNVVHNKLNSNTQVQESDDGFLKITNYGKTIESYEKNDKNILKNTFEEEV